VRELYRRTFVPYLFGPACTGEQAVATYTSSPVIGFYAQVSCGAAGPDIAPPPLQDTKNNRGHLPLWLALRFKV